MDDLDAGFLECRDMLFRAAPRGLHDLDTAFDDRLDEFGIGGAEKAGRKVRLTPKGLSVIW